MYQLTEPPTLKKQEKHTIEVVVDRLTVKGTAKRRLTDSIETALRLSGGLVTLEFVDLPEDDPHRERVFSEHLYCPDDDLSFEELEPRSFSFNSPFGACPACTGIGTTMEVDPELVVPDPGETLASGASRRGQPVRRRSTSRASCRLSLTRSGFAPTSRSSGCRQRREPLCCTVTTARCTSGTRTGTGGIGRTTPPLRGRHPLGPAPPRRGRV